MADDTSDFCDSCGALIQGDSISNETLAMFGLFFCSEQCADDYVLSK